MPGLVRIPEGRLARAIERCERRAGFWARRDLFGRWRDPEFKRLAKALARWTRLESLMGVLEDYNWRVATKRAVLADPGRRAGLREALGGDAAMARWEAAWEAAEAREAGDGETAHTGCGLRGCDCVVCGGEFVGYEYGDGDEDGPSGGTPADHVLTDRRPIAHPGESRDPSHGNPDKAWMTDTFRLASRPDGARSRSSRRTRRMDPGFRRDERNCGRRSSRIPVWPSELVPPCPEPKHEMGVVRPPFAHPQTAPDLRGIRGWRPAAQNPYAPYDRLFPP